MPCCSETLYIVRSCPFCGKAPEISAMNAAYSFRKGSQGYYIICKPCWNKALIPAFLPLHTDREDWIPLIVKAWNLWAIDQERRDTSHAVL